MKEEIINLEGYIYVPSIKLHVSKERKLLNSNWYQCNEKLQRENERMLTIPQFIEFLKYTKTNNQEIYNDITEVRDPWRAEWLDADFKYDPSSNKVNLNQSESLLVFTNSVRDAKGKLILTALEVLENGLMEDKCPGIDLESWLNNPTKQGLPKKDIQSGSLYYFCPLNDNNSVAGFGAGADWAFLVCSRAPYCGSEALGVHPAKFLREVK